ncbi:hypothetical protein NXS19_000838 [Fusarium pseudograminearum]|nr:hypothetical protein NXS19_000838 [Fusarium pseudograminearum]
MADHRAASSLSAYGRRDGPGTPEPPARFSYDVAERGDHSIDGLLNVPPNGPSPFPMTSLFHASILNLVVLQLPPAAFKLVDRNEPVQSDLTRYKRAVPSCFKSP